MALHAVLWVATIDLCFPLSKLVLLFTYLCLYDYKAVWKSCQQGEANTTISPLPLGNEYAFIKSAYDDRYMESFDFSVERTRAQSHSMIQLLQLVPACFFIITAISAASVPPFADTSSGIACGSACLQRVNRATQSADRLFNSN